jgi:acetyltransferase
MPESPFLQIMHPRSIVVAGASNHFPKMGAIQALNLLHGGFAGEVLFLHPKEKEVLGRKAVPTPDDLPYAPDLAFLITPTKVTPSLIDDLGRRGVRRAVIVTAGFREMGAGGAALEAELLAAARRHSLRFVGPNCIGVLNAHAGLNLTVCPYRDRPGRVGLISQSGTYVAQTMPYLQERGIRYGQAISVGNATDLDAVDALDYLGDDPETGAIAMYIEALGRGREFLAVARRVAAKKPVVALYVGGSETGKRSCLSHTGSLGGPDALYDGLFEQAGVIRATTVEELFTWTHALAHCPVPKGNRVAILTHSGGPATSMADACAKAGLAMPELSPALQEKIRPFIEATASAKNPVDLTFSLAHESFTHRIPELLFASDEVDGLLVHGIMDTAFVELLYPLVADRVALTREEFVRAGEFDLGPLLAILAGSAKPLVSSNFMRADHAAQTFRDHDVPVATCPEAAVKTMAALVRYGRIRERLAATTAAVPVAEAADRLPPGVMDEDAAKRLLAARGVPAAREARVTSLAAAKKAARAVGYPVVLKGLAPGVAHKTEAGLVHVGIASPADLARAWAKIEAVAPGCPRLVAQMLSGEREIAIGMTRFKGFGPCVMLGQGGIFAEAVADVTFRVAPLSPGEARAMPDSLALANLWGAVRGLPAVDRDALARALVAVGELALAHPEIDEIDVNPLIVVDGVPIAADALVVVAPE